MEIKLEVWTREERALFNEFMDKMDALRDAAFKAQMDQTWQPLPTYVETVEVVPMPVREETVEVVPVAEPEPADIPDKVLVEAIRAYMQGRSDLADAYAVLREFGANKVGEVPQARRREFLERIGGAP